MKETWIDSIIKMFDSEINILESAISNARSKKEYDLMLRLCVRRDEVLLLFHETIGIINRGCDEN